LPRNNPGVARERRNFCRGPGRLRGNCPRRDRLKLEINGQNETPGIKPGVYEQNIGLKYGSRH